MSNRTVGLRWLLAIGALCTLARADGLLYQFEGETLPDDVAAGWWCGDPCIPPCVASSTGGILTYTWDNGGIRINCNHSVTEPPAEPPPTFWAEWSFASNHAFSGISLACDGTFIVDYKDIVEIFRLFGDVALTFGGIHFITGLEIDEFHTYRFESADGVNWCLYVDGQTLHCDADTTPDDDGDGRVQIGGEGGCTLDAQPTFNRYDFVRYGTLSSGEAIVSSNPPSGNLRPSVYAGIDQFTIRYDQPNYARIDEINVSVTAGDTPIVIKTRRPLNSDPQTIEIVLDRPMTVGETTTFTFTDAPEGQNQVSYTLANPIPATSSWSLAVIALALLIAGTLLATKRRALLCGTGL